MWSISGKPPENNGLGEHPHRGRCVLADGQQSNGRWPVRGQRVVLVAKEHNFVCKDRTVSLHQGLNAT